MQIQDTRQPTTPGETDLRQQLIHEIQSLPNDLLSEVLDFLLFTKARYLQQQELQSSDQKEPWWKQISGRFANDLAYDEAMKLGRDYRNSLRSTS